MRLIDADHLSERVNNSADTPMQKLYVDALLASEPTVSEQKPQTNADRIRAMSDEELARVLNAFTAYFEECNRSSSEVECKDCELYELCFLDEGKAMDWLRQPVKDGEGDG